MESNDILNVILLISGMLIGTCLYMFSYSESNRKPARRTLVICICTSIIFLLSYYWYLEKKVDGDVKSLGIENVTNKNKLQNETNIDKLRDSLFSYKLELEKLNHKLEGYSRILNVSDKQKVLNNRIKSLDAEIDYIDSYNEVLPYTEFSKKRKGETVSGETSSLILYPPTNLDSNFLDFSLLFINDSMVQNVACLYVEIFKKGSDGSLIQLWEEYYQPRKGYNKVRVKNCLKQKDVEMRIGFFWKSEYGKKDYPRFEYVRFAMN